MWRFIFTHLGEAHNVRKQDRKFLLARDIQNIRGIARMFNNVG